MTESMDFAKRLAELNARKCVKCGYCCTVAPCSHGEPIGGEGPDQNTCIFLAEDNECLIYQYILRKEEGTLYPMFGTGCSSTICNEVRDAKVKALRENVEKHNEEQLFK